MSALATGFVLVPVAQADPGQLKRRKAALNVARYIGGHCRLNGHVRISKALVTFYMRALEACAESRQDGGDGRIPSEQTDKMVVKLDGHRQNRHVRRRQEAVERLGKMGLIAYGRGWLEALPMGPKLVDLNAGTRAEQKKNLRAKPPLRVVTAVAPSEVTVIGPSSAGAGLGSAKPCLGLQKKLKKRQTCSPSGAAGRPAQRDAAGRFAPKAVRRECPLAVEQEAVPQLPLQPATIAERSSPAPRQDSDTPADRTELEPPHRELPPETALRDSECAASSCSEPDSHQTAAARPSASEIEPTREEPPMDASPTALETSKAIKDPELALLFAGLMTKDSAWKAERAAKGLPPLEPREPQPRRVMPRLNPLGQVNEPKPVAAIPKASYAMDDDDLGTDVTWLQMELSGCPALKGLHWAWAARQGFSRGLWRQAVAAMVGMPPGRVGDAKRWLMGTLKALKEERGQDPRTRPGYGPMDTWGPVALKFANISA